MVFQDTEHWTTNNRDAWGTGSQGGKFVMVLEFCPERISSGYLFACLLIYLFMVLSSYLGVLNYSLYSYILNLISFYLYYYLYFIIPLSILSLNIFTYVTWKCLSFTREVMLDFCMCISQCWYLLLSIVKKKSSRALELSVLRKTCTSSLLSWITMFKANSATWLMIKRKPQRGAQWMNLPAICSVQLTCEFLEYYVRWALSLVTSVDNSLLHSSSTPSVSASSESFWEGGSAPHPGETEVLRSSAWILSC